MTKKINVTIKPVSAAKGGKQITIQGCKSMVGGSTFPAPKALKNEATSLTKDNK